MTMPADKERQEARFACAYAAYCQCNDSSPYYRTQLIMKALDKFDAQHPQSTINPPDQFIVSEEKLSKEPASCDQNAQAVSGERGTDVEPALHERVLFCKNMDEPYYEISGSNGGAMRICGNGHDSTIAALESAIKHLRWRERQQAAKRTTSEVPLSNDSLPAYAMARNVIVERGGFTRAEACTIAHAIAAAMPQPPKEAT